MDRKSRQASRGRRAWALAGRQHGVIGRRQLLELGFSQDQIKHRIASRRLHPIRRGVYAVGRAQLDSHGHWLAAVLAVGERAVLSHLSAAQLWRIVPEHRAAVEVSVPSGGGRRRSDLVVHRRLALEKRDLTSHREIPVTTPVCTLIDVAIRLNRSSLEAAINTADKLGLRNPDELRFELDAVVCRPGVGILRALLDRQGFRLTASRLERRFLPIARSAGLPAPVTGGKVNGFEVDFFWPELGLVVETDGLRYHRTPAAQARDRLRDQVHTAAGLVCLRFTHSQVVFERRFVRATLATVAGWLAPPGSLARLGVPDPPNSPASKMSSHP